MHLSRRRKQTLDRDFYPCDMNGCVLWLPFYRYGANAQKVWDQSGNANHGTITGAVPGSYPILSRVELISNGGFTTDTSGWTAASAPYEASIASVAGGISGNCLQLTRVGGDVQYAYQNRTDLEYGKSYLVSGWVKSGTSGDESFSLHYLNPALEDKSIVAGTTSSTWTYYSGILNILQPGGTPQIVLLKMSATAGTMLFDSISVQEILGYESLGWGFDGVDDEIVTSSGFGGDGTILMWIRPATQRVQSLIHCGTDWYGNNDMILLRVYADYKVNLCINTVAGGAEVVLPMDSVLPIDRWSLVGATFETNNARVYFNGTLEGTPDTSCNIPPSGGVVTIGNGIGAGNTDWYKGFGGDILVFNRALSAVEIKSYYEKTRRIYGV